MHSGHKYKAANVECASRQTRSLRSIFLLNNEHVNKAKRFTLRYKSELLELSDDLSDKGQAVSRVTTPESKHSTQSQGCVMFI